MKALLIAIIAIAAMTAIGKPASTRWETKPQTHKHGVAYRCPHCGRTWGNTPPNLKAWEARHINKERSKYIALHMRLLHGKNI